MIRSTDRILTTHAGALPRSAELRQMVFARSEGKPYDRDALAARLKSEVAEVVQRQIACGIDSVNDGELGKTSFTNYVRERLSGFETRPYEPGKGPQPLSIASRDMKKFPEYFAGGGRGFGSFVWSGPSKTQVYCVAPLAYVGHAALKQDLENFKAALRGAKVEETFLPANTPGTIEHWLRNEHYPGEEAFVYAIAEAMREEYRGIVDAGFLLQIDDPDLPDGWQMYPEMSVADYRKYATMRVDALNHALRGIPAEKIRLHVCWGSFHGPHQHDIPLRHIIDIIFRVRASSFAQAILPSATRGPRPQSVPPITFSRPTSFAYLARRCATSSGCSMKSLKWPTTPGMSTASPGSFTVSNTRHSCSWQGFEASIE